jgi:hypothetical protein
VEIGIAGGRTLRFTRQPRRTPVNVWSLHQADGSVVEDEGLRYETGGRTVPGWVESLFRITKVEDLDVHIAHQKFPVFLLGEPASRRSAVLSIGQEASYIRDMIAIHKERCTKDLALVRNGERELIAIAAALEALKDIEAVRDALESARSRAGALRGAADRLCALEDQAARLAELARQLERARRRLLTTADLPDPGRLATLRAQLEEERARETVAERVGAVAAALALARRRATLLGALPAQAPVLQATQAREEALDRLRSLGDQAARVRSRLASIDEGMRTLRGDLARLMDETHGRCPTCGSAVEADALLVGHAHPGREAA